jgi:hypothetical protein
MSKGDRFLPGYVVIEVESLYLRCVEALDLSVFYLAIA